MFRNGIYRRYKDLLNGRFEITDVIRIERNEDDHNDIVGKAFDFSTRTIGELREQGYRDGLNESVSGFRPRRLDS